MKAQKIHRDLVDAVRMLQISHGGSGVVTSDSQDSDDDGDDRELVARIENADSLDSLNKAWHDFSQIEARKRCVFCNEHYEAVFDNSARSIYCLYYLDAQLAIMCNVRPFLSSLEIKYDLPCCENLWLARNASDWANCRKQQFSSFNEAEDAVYATETSSVARTLAEETI